MLNLFQKLTCLTQTNTGIKPGNEKRVNSVIFYAKEDIFLYLKCNNICWET